ncbi:MAG: ornithine cyclodeaminase family protein [Deltaproteobacteria bacterium]|nr:ornithine cyclodeaminase family protein [Deltaproteobacteria bacterium]MDZ4342016.1 ornithine cyclodeaminase family protein [Candidatus Binatia bacterium]
MRILNNSEIEQVLTLEDCMEVLEVAYKEHALGKGGNRPRNHTMFPVEDKRYPGFHYRFKSQEGGNLSSGVWALRITSDMAGVETLADGTKRRRLIPAARGNTYVGLITLYSMETLEPLAVLHDSYIQKLRVGATSAMGIRELANPGARVSGLFGSGWQAEAHLRYLVMVQPKIEEVRVYSPTPAHRKSFANEWSDKLGKRIIAVDHPKDAVQGCQIVTCATATMEPCFDGNWLEPGTHVTAITSPDRTTYRCELDETTFDRADILIALSKEQIEYDRQVDIMGPVKRGVKTWEQIGELGDLLIGRFPGRSSKDQITLFANNTGMGIQFAAVGARTLALAEAKGLGREVPTEWFVEETTP